MRHMFDGAPRDEDGRIILGSTHRGCEFCDAEPEPTYSGCGRVVWWHPPFDCCDTRRHLQRKAEGLSAADDGRGGRDSGPRGWVP